MAFSPGPIFFSLLALAFAVWLIRRYARIEGLPQGQTAEAIVLVVAVALGLPVLGLGLVSRVNLPEGLVIATVVMLTLENPWYLQARIMAPQGEVTVRLQHGGRVVNGVGADPDIVVASAKAYLAALNKLLLPDR